MYEKFWLVWKSIATQIVERGGNPALKNNFTSNFQLKKCSFCQRASIKCSSCQHPPANKRTQNQTRTFLRSQTTRYNRVLLILQNLWHSLGSGSWLKPNWAWQTTLGANHDPTTSSLWNRHRVGVAMLSGRGQGDTEGTKSPPSTRVSLKMKKT